MIKILHTADWHLDAPMLGHSPESTLFLQQQSRKIPGMIAQLCKNEACDLMVISGDIFDGEATRESIQAVLDALGSLTIPVVISPGNHDFCHADSPYLKENWPENVHIFKKPQIESFAIPELDCKVYGAGYESMDCPGLLKNFHIEGTERYHIGVFHADATTGSTYFPVTRQQLQDSGLTYVALGHIHKQGSVAAGETLCLWPGCPMGRGFDEPGPKGVIIATLDEQKQARFIPLDTPRFYDEQINIGEDPAASLAAILPMLESMDFYRITLTGYSPGIDKTELGAKFSHIPNLTLRDETLPEPNLWKSMGEDSMEGLLFAQLKEATESPSETLALQATLAARICRSILDGQEVVLP